MPATSRRPKRVMHARTRTRSTTPGSWDYRPLGDALNQLQTIRQYYASRTSTSTARYDVRDDLKQVMLSGARDRVSTRTRAPRAGSTSASSTPTAWASRWSRASGHLAEASRTPRHLEPAAGLRERGARQITEPRIYFGERPSGCVDRRGSARTEFDYPPRQLDSDVVTNRWSGTTGIPLDTTLTRLPVRPSASATSTCSISNQITSQSQLLMNRTIQERVAGHRAVPPLRQGSVPRDRRQRAV